MQFDEFVAALDREIRDLGTVERFEPAQEPPGTRWTTGPRSADLTLVPPLNVRLSLAGPNGIDATTWYPVDEALVAVVSTRIARYLSES